jgi:hypothetical protein
MSSWARFSWSATHYPRRCPLTNQEPMDSDIASGFPSHDAPPEIRRDTSASFRPGKWSVEGAKMGTLGLPENPLRAVVEGVCASRTPLRLADRAPHSEGTSCNDGVCWRALPRRPHLELDAARRPRGARIAHRRLGERSMSPETVPAYRLTGCVPGGPPRIPEVIDWRCDQVLP